MSSSPQYNPNSPPYVPGLSPPYSDEYVPGLSPPYSGEYVPGLSPPYSGDLTTKPVKGRDIKYPSVYGISSEIDSALTFRLNTDMSISNAIRRTILSDIPVVAIDTQKCTIETNQCGGGQHNEYLKHRLDCIPVIVSPEDMPDFVKDYYLSVDVSNDTGNVNHITTEDFKLVPKTDRPRKVFTTDDVFPPYKHKWYIEFAHLKPVLKETRTLKLTSDFKISTAKENAAYNAVYKCTASFTVDKNAATDEWKKREEDMKSAGKSEAEIALIKANFWALDAQRIYIPNSFDFEIRSLGMYRDRELVKHACAILENKLSDAPAKFRAGTQYSVKLGLQEAVQVSNDGDNQTFIIHMGDEDYTLGKVIEYILYEYYYFVDEPEIRFCAFKKMHPHDSYGVLQVSLVTRPDMNDTMNRERIQEILEGVCKIGVKLFSHIGDNFGRAVR